MNNPNPTTRLRMAAVYASGTVRARRWHGEDDVRSYRPPAGWTAIADQTDLHPITAMPCRVPYGGLSRRNSKRDEDRDSRGKIGPGAVAPGPSKDIRALPVGCAQHQAPLIPG